MGLKEDLKEMSMRLGADLFGVASADAFNDAPLRHRPMDILTNAKSIIVLGIKMLDAQADIIRCDHHVQIHEKILKSSLHRPVCHHCTLGPACRTGRISNIVEGFGVYFHVWLMIRLGR